MTQVFTQTEGQGNFVQDYIQGINRKCLNRHTRRKFILF